MGDIPGRPDWGVLRSMMSDLRKATDNLPDLQKQMAAVTGTAWSPDGMIKAVVGPRGHLMELDIDPRLLRNPNSKALSAGIVQTVRLAIEDVGRQNTELLNGSLPQDMSRLGGLNAEKFVGGHDADARVRNEDDHE